MTTEPELTISEELPADHRSGYVAVIGKPNVGKSTLMNALLGQKVAIVSPKPQTTRQPLLGILTRPEAQLIFVDTPGIHLPHHALGEYMVASAKQAIPDADLVCFLVDLSGEPDGADRAIAKLVSAVRAPKLLLLNKADLVPAEAVEARAAAYRALGTFDGDLVISALQGAGLDALLQAMIQRLPLGPRYFPEEQVTDQYMRSIAAEMIREQVLNHLEQEVPHAVAVVVEEYKEREDGSTYIAANVFVEKESQKGIIIGAQGSMLKRIGQAARAEIEAMTGGKVFLELWVKVLKNWRKEPHLLKRLGYAPPRR
ncbi:MAG: GTPase Era [Chloroflexi bacterium]|nr:GTPase Era [Chloroflexota bacterium]